MDSDLNKKFYKAIIDEDLLSIDECIQKGLMIDRTYHYYYDIRSCPTYFTPLICAVQNQRLKVVEHLLKRGAAVLVKSREGETPLSVASGKGNLEIVKLLVENGAKPSMQTALLVAIMNRRLDIVKYMVEKGVFVNWKYKNGDTPLSKAIRSECGEISKFLIDNGANLEELTKDSTPLILSVEIQMLDILKYLLQKGANINQMDNNGRTALSVAASKKYFPFATYLIESGADINLAQKAVDEYATRDEDFDIFLKLFKMEQLKLNNSVENKASVLEKELGSGQEAFPLSNK